MGIPIWAIEGVALDSTGDSVTDSLGDRVSLLASTLSSGIVEKTNALDGSGTYNLFQVTGSVLVNSIWGYVSEAMPAATTAASLQLFPTAGAAIQLTSLAGSDISSLPIGSVLMKGGLAANAIGVGDNTLGYLLEESGFIFAKFTIGQKIAVNTFIRLNVTEGNTDGTIIWKCNWLNLSTGATLVAV